MPCPIMEVGKWHGTNQKKKEQTDIDVVGLNPIEKKAILGECKFRNSPIDKAALDVLLERTNLIDKKYEVISYYLFSLSGFTNWLTTNAAKHNTKLITIKEMYASN